MGKVDTLFIKNKDEHIIVVQIYVNDIIFGAINESLCDYFSKRIHSEFEIRIMREFNFFLGLQISNPKKGFLSTNPSTSRIS